MRVLIVSASRHGATAGIAKHIGSVLSEQGIEVDVRSTAEMRRPGHQAALDGYDAFVIGSAIYAFHWLGEARDFVRHNAPLLEHRPVWLFGSGPLGDQTTDDKGQDLLKPPAEMVDLAELIGARDSRVFFGAYDPTAKPIGMLERFVRLAPAGGSALPAGDFRDWPQVAEWARGIAGQLAEPVAAAVHA